MMPKEMHSETPEEMHSVTQREQLWWVRTYHDHHPRCRGRRRPCCPTSRWSRRHANAPPDSGRTGARSSMRRKATRHSAARRSAEHAHGGALLHAKTPTR